jgi:glycosyltransferase involved in cell wall biosynthesis
MALGKPVIATRVGGVPEIIEHGVSGLLVGAENASALADAMTGLFSDRTMAERLGCNGAARVRGHFSPEARADAIISLYREVLSTGRVLGTSTYPAGTDHAG